MATITIRDDCLTPDRFIRISYSGPNPWGVQEFLAANLKEYFHVSTSKVNNYRINWDITGDPISFYSRWWVRKATGRFSQMYFNFKIVGTKGKVKNEGKFSLSFHARVITNFNAWSPLLQPLWTLYGYLFYNRVRRKNIEICRNYLMNFRNMIKEHFNVETTEIPMSSGF